MGQETKVKTKKKEKKYTSTLLILKTPFKSKKTQGKFPLLMIN